MFITQQDIEKTLPQEMLTAAMRADEDRITNAVNYALSMVRSYIGGKYDCDFIFSQTGGNRHPLIKDITIAIAAWHVISKGLNPRNVPEIKKDDYDNAVTILKNIANDKANPDLPLLQQAQKSTRVKLSPGNKKSYRW